ncbi:MAG: DUF2236 domain-containing protein [Alphaproteobacteria bacterium]|nr:DUF2236 domain-containing protein [Alphaproteobacteria bacterium]
MPDLLTPRLAGTPYAIDFGAPLGEPALVSPLSPQWRVFKNPVALAIGGVAAVLLEFADARIRTGVWAHSIYPQDPIGRSARTGAAALIGVYGPASVARRVIAGVNRMHAKVGGETPAGEPYRATDPELLDWVSATAVWGFLAAYRRFVAAVGAEEARDYYADGAGIAALYGVVTPLGSDADFDAMLGARLPRFEPHAIVGEFLGIIASGRAAPGVPRRLHRSLARAAVALLPEGVRDRLELGRDWDLSLFDRLALGAMAGAAERRVDPASSPCRASVRLGLPPDFLYRKPAERARLVAAAGLA